MQTSHARPAPRRAFALLSATLLATLAAALSASVAAAQAPDVIALPPGWQPEGIAAGRGDDLYSGSLATGAVLRVDARTGNRRIVVEGREGRVAVGLKYHRGLLFVAGGPTGRGFVYDARTGREVANVLLTAAPTFINDVSVTRRGVAWFTDSQRRRLYGLSLTRRRGGPPIEHLIRLPIRGELRYDDDPNTFEVNGIAAARGGRVLLVVQSRTGKVFRVDARTGVSREIRLRGGAGNVENGDGMLLVGRTLYVVQNFRNRIAEIRLSRRLTSGRIRSVLRDDDLDVPTTVARRLGALYAVNARFGTTPTPTTEYQVVRVEVPRRSR